MKPKIKKDSVVLSARDMLNGYVSNNSDVNIYNMTPLQMIPANEKDEDWKKWNLDWLERAGLRQIGSRQRSLYRNYDLANGVINPADYIIGPENEFSDSIQQLVAENQNPIPIKFYPIIPNVINIMVGEFSKRDSRVIVKAVDETSINEAYDYKKKLLTDILVQRAEQKKLQALSEMGLSDEQMQSEEVQKEIEASKMMADAEIKFKSYRGIVEQWANHMIQLDNDRFNMYEKEIMAFRDSLVVDREFWHIKIKEDDYTVDVWNPLNVFYHKSPNTLYVADGNFVGKIEIMSIPDVIDTYGDRMTEEQILNLKNHYRTLNNYSLVTDGLKDQENHYTDFTKPYNSGGRTNVTWQKYLDSQVSKTIDGSGNGFRWFDLTGAGGSTIDFTVSGPGMVRVMDTYWKSQKRVGHLLYKKRNGEIIEKTINEDYVITEEAVYDTSLIKNKSKANLIYGEHIDWIWINEVREGVKINSSLSTYYTRNYSDFEPIYIGGDPIPFQFKGTSNLYGCKLPVEGRIFSERNSTSSSMVDKMKSNQINFNIVNNQIVEFLADEAGNVIVMDQNMIPRNSQGGTWGQNNFGKFFQVMKDYQIAPIDPSIRNTENATNFSHFQVVDMSKTNQIVTRIDLSRYFKEECFSVVGITPQRLGAVTASESATGTQQAVNNSYAQTEPYFDQHMNQLMPRVRQMMVEAAQFMCSTKPRSRFTYLNSDEENVLFEINGDDLLLRDLKVYAKSTANVKATVEKLQQLFAQNNTAGGSLAELAQVMTLQSPAEIISKLKEAEDKRSQIEQSQKDHELEMQQQQQSFLEKEEEKQRQHEDFWKEKELQKDIYVAQIKAMGYASESDVDANNIPDVLETQKFLHQQGIDATKQFMEQSKVNMKQQELSMKEREMQSRTKLEHEKMRHKEKIERLKLKNPVSGEVKKK